MPDISALAVEFQVWKQWMVDTTGLAKDGLHIHFGLMVFMGVRLLWRWRFGWVVAWLAALAFTLGGEWLDLRGEAIVGAFQPDSEHWHDVWNTMVWPTVLLLLGRWLEPRRVNTEAREQERSSGEDAQHSFEQA
jgi:hypothetical protein